MCERNFVIYQQSSTMDTHIHSSSAVNETTDDEVNSEIISRHPDLALGLIIVKAHYLLMKRNYTYCGITPFHGLIEQILSKTNLF